MLKIIDNIGYMKLMDGTSLLAHKKSTEQKIEDNKKTGHVFSNEESEMFFKNAYFLWKHRAEIRKDSKMLLASVRVSSGTANCCSLKDATLGAFLDFWDGSRMKALKDVREELLKDKEGVDEVPLETLIANLKKN